jgi:hypothetical protein
MPAIALSVYMPIAVGLQKTRTYGLLTALAYYAGASWPLLPGAKAFFGTNATWADSLLLWLLSSFLLALPFGIFWTRKAPFAPAGDIFRPAGGFSTPLGLIGWASPLTAAGVLFPGMAWLGLILMLALCALPCRLPRFMAAAAGSLLFMAQATYQKPATPPLWQAVDTKFGPGFSASDPRQEFDAAEAIQSIARDSDRRVIIFPEMVLHRWNDATEAFWEPTLTRLRQAGKTVLIGAGLSVPGQSLSYRNAVVILGSHPQPVHPAYPGSDRDVEALQNPGGSSTAIAWSGNDDGCR